MGQITGRTDKDPSHQNLQEKISLGLQASLELTSPGVILTLQTPLDLGELGGIINHSLNRTLLFDVIGPAGLFSLFIIFIDLVFLDC